MVQSVYSSAWASLTAKTGTVATTGQTFVGKAAPPSPPVVSAASGGDTVSVSKLGKALTGLAANAFEHLDSDSKKQLESLVESGRVSADDAVKGLRSLAKSALFNRFLGEAPVTAEEAEAGEKGKAISEQRFAAMKAGPPQDMRDAMRDMVQLTDAKNNGTVSKEDADASLVEIGKRLRAGSAQMAQAVSQEDSDEEYRLLNVVFGSKANRFADIDFGEDDHETRTTTGKIQSKDELDAEERLFAAGFDLRTNAMSRFAADYDVPGLGKKAMPPWKYMGPISK